MAYTVEEFPKHSGKGRKSRTGDSPLTVFLDGQKWCFVRGADFNESLTSMRTRLLSAAVYRGLSCAVMTQGDKVYFQAIHGTDCKKTTTEG